MKKIILISLLLTGVFFFSNSARSQESYYPYSYARISYVQGSAQVDRGNELGIEAAEVNYALTNGDKVMTDDGLVEINFGKRNLLRLGRYSIVEIASLPSSDDENYSLYLHQGKAYLRITSSSMEKEFAVHTPDASFYILDHGLYRFEVGAQGQSGVTVLKGSLEASGQEESLVLEAGESISASDGYLEKSQAGESFDDELAAWNSDRDQLLFRTEEQRSSYLPEEINEYEPELSSYGRWVYERPYGYVWVPAITLADWRPYLIGRWVWYPRIGWTWVSSEPWGWAVYHYGRWQWRLGLGWYWIPTVQWGPAWVHWYWDADFVAWCPLSYWNRPMVIINNHVYERYNEIYYPVQSRALVMVRRNQIQAPFGRRSLVRPEELRGVEKIRLAASQPQIKPVVNAGWRNNSTLVSPSIPRGTRVYPENRSSRLNKGINSSIPAAKVQSDRILRENGKQTNYTSRNNYQNPTVEALRPGLSSSSTLKPRVNQNSPGQNYEERRTNPNIQRPTIRSYPERSVAVRSSADNQPQSWKKESSSRVREYPRAARKEVSQSDSFRSYTPKSSTTRESGSQRISSSYNLPTLTRPYNQPQVRNRSESSQNHNYSSSRSESNHSTANSSAGSHSHSSSPRKKNG
ncbi:MAG: DUF6600 domain-containing protein [Candidatus Saccharicenans sp.]